jgi:hypothetical protein
MRGQNFSLQPFQRTGLQVELKITGSITRRSNNLTICYQLLGSLNELLIPVQADAPARRNRLWEETCFEFFIGAGDTGPYWEFNLSPSGNWNVYRFKDYRREMHEELSLTSLPFYVGKHTETLRLELELDLDTIVPVEQAMKVAVSAVIKHMDGEVSYWALTHSGPQPDFHRQDSFIIEL